MSDFNRNDAIEMRLDEIAEGEESLANTLANYLLEENLEDNDYIPIVLVRIYNKYLADDEDGYFEEKEAREIIESYQNYYTRLAIAMLYPKDEFSKDEFESVSELLIYKNNGHFENVKELKDKLNEEIEQYEEKQKTTNPRNKRR